MQWMLGCLPQWSPQVLLSTQSSHLASAPLPRDEWAFLAGKQHVKELFACPHEKPTTGSKCTCPYYLPRQFLSCGPWILGVWLIPKGLWQVTRKTSCQEPVTSGTRVCTTAGKNLGVCKQKLQITALGNVKLKQSLQLFLVRFAVSSPFGKSVWDHSFQMYSERVPDAVKHQQEKCVLFTVMKWMFSGIQSKNEYRIRRLFKLHFCLVTFLVFLRPAMGVLGQSQLHH